MKRASIIGSIIAALSVVVAPLATHAQGNALVYADFETVADNRPVSARGGLIQLVAFQEDAMHKATVKGLNNSDPPAPELVRINKDDPSKAMKFDFDIQAPNQWAGAGVEIHGLPDKDGKPVADDVSEYKTLSMQVFAKGVQILRLEAISHGQGIELSGGYPMMTFKVREGFNTYKTPLKAFAQPSWVDTHVDAKQLFKKLTSINLQVFCDECRPMQGMVVVDNVVFEK